MKIISKIKTNFFQKIIHHKTNLYNYNKKVSKKLKIKIKKQKLLILIINLCKPVQ